jgi:hypothetical protein
LAGLTERCAVHVCAVTGRSLERYFSAKQLVNQFTGPLLDVHVSRLGAGVRNETEQNDQHDSILQNWR